MNKYVQISNSIAGKMTGRLALISSRFHDLYLLKEIESFIDLSSDINEGVKAILFMNKKEDESKRFRIGKLVTLSPYIPTFTNLLNPSEYDELPSKQKQKTQF